MNDRTRSLREEYLRAMGVDVWVRRRSADADSARIATAPPRLTTVVDSPPQEPVLVAHAPAKAEETLDWDVLAAKVAACTRCELHNGRTQTVFGVGNRNAEWLIVGEAPGAEEDKRGEPFVGRAGQLLNSMLGALGLRREQVYIANILKCRPPNNRDPQPPEVVCCEPYLQQQIALLKPRIILAVGRIAAQNLLKVTTPIGKLRGQRYQYGPAGIPLVVTYHPAYLLRSPGEKRRAWQDLLFAERVLRESV